MTPKEKAKELIVKFKDYAHTDWDEFYGFDQDSKRHNAKQCALKCADEVLNSLNNIHGHHSTLYEEEDFWKEVKQEIKDQ